MDCVECRAKEEREWLEKVGFQIINWSMVIPPFLEVAPFSRKVEGWWKVHTQYEHDLVVFHKPPRYFARIMWKWWYMAPLDGKVLGPLTWTTAENVRTVHQELLPMNLSLSDIKIVDRKKDVFQFQAGSETVIPMHDQKAYLLPEAVFGNKLLSLTPWGDGFPSPDIEPEESRKHRVFLGCIPDTGYFFVRDGVLHYPASVSEFLESLLTPRELQAVAR